MSQQIIVNIGDTSVVVDVEEKEGKGFSFREHPKGSLLDESYSGRPRVNKKSRDGYIPPDVLEMRNK